MLSITDKNSIKIYTAHLVCVIDYRQRLYYGSRRLQNLLSITDFY